MNPRHVVLLVRNVKLTGVRLTFVRWVRVNVILHLVSTRQKILRLQLA